MFLIFILVSGVSIAQSQEATSNTTSQYEPESGWGNYFVDKVNAGDIGHIAIAINFHGGDINAYNRDGDTALHVAIRNRHGYIVRFLLENGAEPDLPTLAGEVPLIIAVSSMIEELAQGVDSFAFNGIMFTTKGIVLHLLRKRANPNLRNPLGPTALEIAVKHDFLELASDLLEAGADPDIEVRDEDGNTTTIRDMLNQKIGLI